MLNYLKGSSSSDKQIFVGEAIGSDDSQILINVKNPFQVGDKLELITPERDFTFVLEDLLDEEKIAVSEARGSGYKVWIDLPKKVNCKNALLVKCL